MRYLVLLVVVVLAGCESGAKYASVAPWHREAVLAHFDWSGSNPLRAPSAEDLERERRNWGSVRTDKPVLDGDVVIVLAANQSHQINYKTSVLVEGGESLDGNEAFALKSCQRIKRDSESCYVVYRGGWTDFYDETYPPLIP